jgi:hypothetical protein
VSSFLCIMRELTTRLHGAESVLRNQHLLSFSRDSSSDFFVPEAGQKAGRAQGQVLNWIRRKSLSLSYLMSDYSGQQIVVLTTTWWWQKLGRDWQWVNKQSTWRMPSSGILRRVDPVWTHVSEESIAYIFRVEMSACEELAWAGGRRTDSSRRWNITAWDP